MTHQLLRDGPLLVAALLVVAGLTHIFVKSTTVAIWSLVGAFVATQAIVPPLELQVALDGISIYPLDLVAGLMFAIGVAWLLTRPGPVEVSLPLLGLSVLFVIHVAWGATALGLQVAVNSSRLWLYLLGPLVYCVHARRFAARESLLPLIAGAAVLAPFALLQIARNGLHGAAEFIYVGGELVDARPVSAAGALLIVQCLLIAVAGRFVRTLPWLFVIAALAAAVLLLQYRTVWVVAGLVVTVAYLKWARRAIYVNDRAATLAASVILLVSPVIVALVASSGAFAESIQTARGGDTTLDWRTASWESLIETHSSPEDVVLGLPTGTSLERQVGDTIATQSAHSLYVDALLTFGVLGPFAVLWLWVLVVRHRHRAAAVLELSAVSVVLLVVSQAVFGITNMLGPLQGVLLGILLQAAWITRRDDLRGDAHVSSRGNVVSHAPTRR